MNNGYADLWREVLYVTIQDALFGSKPEGAKNFDAIAITYGARNYLTHPNRDFNLICTYAGIDPQAARDRLKKLIANAPSPEELVATPVRRKRQAVNSRPGVGCKSRRARGTGAGTTAQERSKITFPPEKARP